MVNLDTRPKTKGLWFIVDGLLFVVLTIYHLPFTIYTAFAAEPDFGPAPAGLKQLQEMLTRIINLSSELAFIILTVMMILAGIKFLTSGGDAKALQSAGQTITWALLGLLFLALAWLILILIRNFTGVDVAHFCLGLPGGANGC